MADSLETCSCGMGHGHHRAGCPNAPTVFYGAMKPHFETQETVKPAPSAEPEPEATTRKARR